jgi:XisH protein
MQIDLGAEKLIAAEKDNQKIAVEIKSFLRTSKITDFYNALGQFLPYKVK